MNRRGFFSFLPAAAIGVAAGVSLRAEASAPPAPAPNVVRSSPEHKCACGSHLHHFVPVSDLGHTHAHPASHQHTFNGGGGWSTGEAVYGKPVCSWCAAPWGGSTS